MRGVAYGRSYLLRLLTRLGPRPRALLRPVVGAGPVMVTGAPPTSGLLLRDLRLDHVQAWGLVRGVLEPPVQEALRRTVGPGVTFWDVGANVGFFSLLAARLGGTVHAFEPVRENVEVLAGNIRENGLNDRIHVHPVAVAAEPGRASLLVVEDPSWSHLADRGRHPRTREEVDVEVVTLDGLELSPPDVVKIDVEGSEIDVLEGMRRTIERHRPAVVCELHGTGSRFVELMESFGYSVTALDGPGPVGDGHAHALAVAS